MPHRNQWVSGGVAESVDARDLKSLGMKILWGFKSPRPHPTFLLSGPFYGQSVNPSLRSGARNQIGA